MVPSVDIVHNLGADMDLEPFPHPTWEQGSHGRPRPGGERTTPADRESRVGLPDPPGRSGMTRIRTGKLSTRLIGVTAQPFPRWGSSTPRPAAPNATVKFL